MKLPDRLVTAGLLLLLVFSTEAALAAFTPSATEQKSESQLVTIGQGDELAEVLQALLELTRTQVYLLGPVNLQTRVDSMTGHPAAVLKTLLQNYSYVATRAAAGSAPGVTIILSLSETSAAADAMTDETQGAWGDTAAELSPATATQADRPPRRDNLTQLARQRVVNGRSTAAARSQQVTAVSEETVPPETSDPVDRDAAEAVDGSVVESALTAAEKDAEKQRLEAKITAVDKYIKSGKAEKEYLFWANIKDPKYIYDPWQELAQLKTRYSQL